MQDNLSGVESARLLMCALQEYSPYGAVSTWHTHHPERKILEIKDLWSKNLRKQGLEPKPALWNLVMEGAYRRALEELPPTAVSPGGQTVHLDEKIAFWRQNIPDAAGATIPDGYLLEAQRDLQLNGVLGGIAAGTCLHGDLVGWRQTDLCTWRQMHPGVSPTAPTGASSSAPPA